MDSELDNKLRYPPRGTYQGALCANALEGIFTVLDVDAVVYRVSVECVKVACSPKSTAGHVSWVTTTNTSM
jgi:hypothetical protein